MIEKERNIFGTNNKKTILKVSDMYADEQVGDLVKYEIDNTNLFLIAVFASGRIAVVSVPTLQMIRKIEVPGLEA